MELPALFATALIVGFSGAMVPGPLLTLAIGESVRLGILAGPLLVLGHGILELALIIAIAGGLSVFLTQPAVSQVIAVAGGGFLLYMGGGLVNDARKRKVSLSILQPGKENNGFAGQKPGAAPQPAASAAAGARQMMRPVVAGALVSLSNPYWTIWWATVGLGYITLSLERGIPGLTFFFTGHILADLAWYTLVAAAVAGGRRFMNDQVYQVVLAACGVFMVGLGGYFICYGLLT